MQKIISFLVLQMGALVVFGQDVIAPPKPITTISDPVLVKSTPNSSIDIPVSMALTPFFKYAEKMVDTVFTSPNYPEGWVNEACDVRYQYRFSRGPLRMKAVDNKLQLSFTGYYGVRGSTRVCAKIGNSPWTPACSCGFGKEAPRKIDAGFVMGLRLMPDYRLSVSTAVINPVAANKCEVCFFGKDVTATIAQTLKSEMQLSVNELQQTLTKLNFRSYLQPVWDSLQKPLRITGFGHLFLQPQSLRISQLAAKNDSLLISFGLDARPELKADGHITPSQPLPPLTDFNHRNGFMLHIAQLFPYDSLNRIVNAQLGGKEIILSKGVLKKVIRIDSAHLQGGDDQLFVKIFVSKAAQGVFYLQGKPEYDSVSQTISLQNLDYQVDTRQWLIKSANYLLNSTILNKLRAQTRFSVSDNFHQLKQTLEKQFNKILAPGVRSFGEINGFTIQHIQSSVKGLFVQGTVSGAMRLQLDSGLLMQQYFK